MHSIELPSIHPGEILREEFLAPLELSPYGLAKALEVPRTRIERLVREETPVTTDTALRLARYFGTSAEFWINLQTAFELRTEREAKRDAIARITPRGAVVVRG